MIRETIQAVNEAEEKAAQTVRDAKEHAAAVIEQAKGQAEEILRDARARAKEIAKAGRSEDEKTADAVSERFAEQIGKEADAQEVLAAAKKAEAVCAVVGMITGEQP